MLNILRAIIVIGICIMLRGQVETKSPAEDPGGEIAISNIADGAKEIISDFIGIGIDADSFIDAYTEVKYIESYITESGSDCHYYQIKTVYKDVDGILHDAVVRIYWEVEPDLFHNPYIAIDGETVLHHEEYEAKLRNSGN